MRQDLLNKLFNFVVVTSKLFNIDESHSISHSMNVYYYSNKIYTTELQKNVSFQKVKFNSDNSLLFSDNSLLSSDNSLLYSDNSLLSSDNSLLSSDNSLSYKNIIDVSAILHDMCDKKYMNEKVGIERIDNFIKTELKMEINHLELDIIKKIISTMSYSTVKKNGFPDLKEYQLAYNVVREADLLTSYDFDRCIIYNMIKYNNNYKESFYDALNVFENRVFKYHDDNLFFTKYALIESNRLKYDAINRIKLLKNLL
jgi:hypothetical protein